MRGSSVEIYDVHTRSFSSNRHTGQSKECSGQPRQQRLAKGVQTGNARKACPTSSTPAYSPRVRM